MKKPPAGTARNQAVSVALRTAFGLFLLPFGRPCFFFGVSAGLGISPKLLQDLFMGRVQPDQLPIISGRSHLLCTGEHGHDFLAGSVIREFCLVKSLAQPECQECGQEVAELTSYHRRIILHTGFIEFTCLMKSPHADFRREDARGDLFRGSLE